MPQLQLPMPTWPPATKPPSVAVRRVDGCMRSSWPCLACAAISACSMMMPGSVRILRSRIQRTFDICVISSTIPPASGMPWPQFAVPAAPRAITGMRWRAAAAATRMTSSLAARQHDQFDAAFPPPPPA